MVPKRASLREVRICALVATFTEWCSESALGIGLKESELVLTLFFGLAAFGRRSQYSGLLRCH